MDQSRDAASSSSASAPTRDRQSQNTSSISSNSNSTNSQEVPRSSPSRKLSANPTSPKAPARRHPSVSSSLSCVTNFPDNDEQDDSGAETDEAGSDHERHARYPAETGTRASQSPPSRPTNTFTRAGSGLPLAWHREAERESSPSAVDERSQLGSDRGMTDSPDSFSYARVSTIPASSGIAQQRLANAASTSSEHGDSSTAAEDLNPPPPLNLSYSNVTHRRPHAPSLGAYSHSSTSSFASSSSSPPSSHIFSSNLLGSARLGGIGGAAPSEDAFSPPTSVGTGVGSSGAAAGLHSRQHSQQSPTLPISIASSVQLGNVGIGISTSTSSQGGLPDSTGSTSPHASPAFSGPASMPAPSTIVSNISPIPTPTTQTRLNTTPFLPSPLAQASLAPGEEEGEQMEMFGLDAAITEQQDKKATSPPGNWGSASGSTTFARERTGRTTESSTSQFAAAAGYSIPAGLRRSTSVSQAGGYKSSTSRRRISSISQQQAQAAIVSGTSASPPHASPSSMSSPLGSVVPLTGAAAVAASAVQRPGSPSPLRKEASLLSASRDSSDAPIPAYLAGTNSGSGSDSSSSNSGGITHSPTPRPAKYQHISIPTQAIPAKPALPSAGLSSSGSNNSPGAASSSASSPSDYRFPPPHQAVVSGPASAFRARQMSISSSGSAVSANSAPSRQHLSTGGIHHSPTSAAKSLSPPNASALSMSASSPGLSYHVTSGSHRSNSMSVQSRGTHGRSESLSSAVGASAAMASSPSSASSAALSTSPSATFRHFPSAPPVATPSLLSSSFNFSPSSSVASPAISPPGHQPLAQASVSPSSSITSSTGGRAEGAPLATTVGGIRLQRVPTSVRLAQELHPISPAIEKRRLSIDPSTATSSSMVTSTSSLSAFKIGGPGPEHVSSSSSSSETEYRRDDGQTGLKLPATPMATRRNTPSPSAGEEDATLTSAIDVPGEDQFAKRVADQQSGGLASPFNVHGQPQQIRQRSPSGSPSKTSPSTSMRSLSIPTPPTASNSAYAPLFPFSVPRSQGRSSLSSSLAEPGPSSSPPTLSRSHSRSRSKGHHSPIFNRLSPKMSSDPFGSNDSSVPSSSSHFADTTVSPKTAKFPSSGHAASGSLTKRNTISGLGTSVSATSLFEPVSVSTDSPVAGQLSPPFMSPRAPVAASTSTSPSIKKQFRTSMMPGTISTSSTEDYARHLQESRASKLRKWVSTNPVEDQTAGLGGAGNTFGAGSDIQAAGKARRRAGIPDFSGFGYDRDRLSQDYRDELAGDLGYRPGTAGSREIEWVDWLDEYKRMKEAKIRAEQEEKQKQQQQQQQQLAQHQSLGDVAEAVEVEGEDVAPEAEQSRSAQARKTSDGFSVSGSVSRRGSGGDKSEETMPFPTSRPSQDSPEIGNALPPRARRLSTASLASLSLLDTSRRKRASQDSLAGGTRTAVPPVAVQRKALGGRSISYAPPTAYSAMRQDDPQPSSASQPKKRKNIASKIDAWWSAVTKSFTSTSDDKKSPPPPPPPMSRPSPASGAAVPQLPELPMLTSGELLPAVSIDPADLPGRTSAHYARPGPSLTVPPNKLRHTASASDLTPEKKVYGGGQLPMGALAPAAKVPTHYEPHGRVNSAGSEGDGSSGSGGASRSEFKRRNPQLSLRLDPRFQPAGTSHRLVQRPSATRTSSTSLSSSSGPPSLPTEAVFKEPRLPAAVLARQSEQTPSLTPGQSPIWDKTPGLVPMSQGSDFRLVRSISRSSSTQKPFEITEPTPPAPSVPSFSMSHIREHIKHRLTGAKHNCDKELKKIIAGITIYVEKELENERALTSGLVSREEEEVAEGHAISDSPAVIMPNEEIDVGDDAEDELESRIGHSMRPKLHHTDTNSSTSTDPPQSGLASPTLTFLQHPRQGSPQGPPIRRGRSSGHASPRRASMPSKRHPLGAPVRPAELAERLERSLNLDQGGAVLGSSRTTSASTSRSRSPMPHQPAGSSVNRNSSAEWFKKHDAPEDEDKRSFLSSLQEIVAIAMEIQDTSVTDLTDDPSACAHLISRVQSIGKRWDVHPTWPLRSWYVQLLLAVAGLSRVAEFWAEERGFWNFEDQKGTNDNEPILFVAKAPPQEDEISIAGPSRSRAASTVLGLGRTPARESGTYSVPSPLGIDLGIHRVEEEAPADTSLKVSAPPMVPDESSRAEEAEVLREAVEEVRSATIVMELALDGDSFQYLSPVWEDVVGLPPNVCLGRPISHLLHPDDAAVFSEASKHLQLDDSHTVEAHFRLRVFSESEDPDDHTAETFEAMEGKGMLIRDRMQGMPLHTMWVIRPVPNQNAPSDDGEATTVRPSTASYAKAFADSVTSFASGGLPTQPILCRICDRQIPTWFFEKHNETCNETHRLEVDITETNDKLADLRTVAAALIDNLKSVTSGAADVKSPAEYQDMPLLPARYRDGQLQFLEELLDTLGVALQVSTPALSDDQIPVEEQKLLSPNSEDRLSFLQKWEPPKSEDPALRRLAEDLAELCRQKTTVVNRLRNTIVYVERIRVEWESQAQALLVSQSQQGSDNQSPPSSPAPTILPSSARPSISAGSGEPDLSDQPTPIVPTGNVFLGRPAVGTQGPPAARRASIPLDSASPASLLQSLPALEDDGFINSGGSSNPRATPLSPSLLPISPRLPAAAPLKNVKASTSIKDFDIIKPISKGAFGSVYLAKKRNTGDYYAIKVLKKADMIAKNQVTNVKAERKIMMTQADSDFAVKLYWTFQSKDYLYLVMEYLNGGDCASLIKVMGCLDEDWAKSYVAEIVLGLEYLHGRGIVHRDLKPDNLLIDSRGHLRLTDFGLSRFGLLGRQARTINQSASQLSRRLHRRALPKTFPQAASELSTPDSQPRASYFGSITLEDADAMSESSGSESVPDKNKSRNSESPAISLGSNSGKLLPHVPSPNRQSDSHRFVGTVDYVAPESILGVGVGEGVDWWALGVICHEFLTSFPPFHADTPEQVFDNILSRRIDWHEDEVDWSPEARDFVDKLLCPDPGRRLGAKGAEEVKRHPFLRGINWTKLRESEANFVPQVTDPESTDYFDDRGASNQVFQEDQVGVEALRPNLEETRAASDPAVGSALAKTFESQNSTPADDFGTFNFKNLDVLKQANDDVIRKLRHEQLIPPAAEASNVLTARKPRAKRSSFLEHRVGQPTSPSTSTTSSASSALPNYPFAVMQSHKRRPSNQIPARLKGDLHSNDDPDSFARRNSMPANMRRASFGNMDMHSRTSDGSWHQGRKTSGHTDNSPASSLASPVAAKLRAPRVDDTTQASNTDAGSLALPGEKTVDCLIAEDNPISSKILETILVRLGCLCVVVHNGEEAIRCSMGELAFDVIFMDMLMPILDGENAARMIKSTNNANQNTPIVAVTSYAAHERAHITEEGTLFSAVLTKPVSKTDVLNVLTKLGFVAKTKMGVTSVTEEIAPAASEATPDGVPSAD